MIPAYTRTREFVSSNRPLAAIAVSAFLAELAYAILNLSALPMYVKFVLHKEAAWGVILSTFLLTEAVSRPAFGALGDRFGRKPLLVAGPAITAVTAYLTIQFQGPWAVLGLIGLRAIDGLGSGALWPSAFAAVGDVVPERNRGAAMSVLNVSYMSGLALAFLLGGAANELFHTYNASFYLASGLMALAMVVMLVFLPRDIGSRDLEPLHGEALEVPTLEEPTEFKFRNLLRSFQAVPDMLVLAVVVFLGMGILMPIIKLYAVEHLGMNETQFGVVVAPVAALMGLGAVPLGKLGDRYGKCVAVCWGLLFSALAMWVLAIFRSVLLAVFSGGVLGLGFTIAFPAWMAMVSSTSKTTRRGEVLGAVGMAQGLAAIVGVTAGAFIYSHDSFSLPRLGIVNYNLPFWLSAVLLSAGAVVSFTWVCGRRSGRESAGAIRESHRRAVVTAALAGVLAVGVWVGLRYTQPVSPDRVAWLWMQQVASGRPESAMEYVAPDRKGWQGDRHTRRASDLFTSWRRQGQGRYTVFFADHRTEHSARVPVRFTFLGNRTRYLYVTLCRDKPGEWQVCGLSWSR